MIETFNSPQIPVFFDTKRLHAGVPAYQCWDPSHSTRHHWLIAGNSGFGKTTHAMLCLSKSAKYLPDARLYLLDFKGSDDFRYLRDVPGARYYSHTTCVDGLRLFSEEIESRLQENLDRTPVFLFFDEYSSFIAYTSVIDKKVSAQCQMWLMNALFMSRSVSGYCLLCTQRPDQSVMPSGGARDQFGVRVWWGRFSSPDAARMMFNDMKIPEDYVGGVGIGLAYMDGLGLLEVTAPRIRRMSRVKDAILDFVTR